MRSPVRSLLRTCLPPLPILASVSLRALSPLLGYRYPVDLRPLARRFLAPAERLGDFLEALALARQRFQLRDLVRSPWLAVSLEALAHALAAFFFAGAFLAAGFLAGAFLRPFFFAGPFAARASISSMACASVTSSGFMSFGSVALVVPSVT